MDSSVVGQEAAPQALAPLQLKPLARAAVSALFLAHFLASPEIRQQQVKLKLGYIGSRERGWGALGKKTFLRHPEIAEASKARRLVQYEREAKRGS